MTDLAAVVATLDWATVSSVVIHSGKRRMLDGIFFYGVVAPLRFPRRISRLGEKDSCSTAGCAVLGVAVAAYYCNTSTN